MKFKVGDLVKQIQAHHKEANPLARVVRIDGDKIYHKHRGEEKKRAKHVRERCLRLVERKNATLQVAIEQEIYKLGGD